MSAQIESGFIMERLGKDMCGVAPSVISFDCNEKREGWGEKTNRENCRNLPIDQLDCQREEKRLKLGGSG